jgi:hypothetical protein
MLASHHISTDSAETARQRKLQSQRECMRRLRAFRAEPENPFPNFTQEMASIGVYKRDATGVVHQVFKPTVERSQAGERRKAG